MKRLIVAMAAAVLACPAIGLGEITSYFNYTNQLNKVSFDNYEVILRSAAETDSGAFNLGTDTDPRWFTEQVAADIAEGDYLAQIYVANFLYINGVLQTEANAPGISKLLPTLTAYAVQQVTSITLDDPFGGYTKLTFGAVDSDPFGVMSDDDVANEVVVKLFSDPNGSVFTQNSSGTIGVSLKADVENATDGSMWASFGFGDPLDESGLTDAPFLYSLISPLGAVNVYGGLNVKDFPNGLTFTGVLNSEIPSSLGHTELTSIGVEASISEYLFHKDLNGDSYWRYNSDDPFELRMTPEPSSLIGCLGLMMTGLGVWTIRRRSKRSA